MQQTQGHLNHALQCSPPRRGHRGHSKHWGCLEPIAQKFDPGIVNKRSSSGCPHDKVSNLCRVCGRTLNGVILGGVHDREGRTKLDRGF